MKKYTIVFATAIILVFASCSKDGEKVQPTYYSPAEFKCMTASGKASMHLIGPIAGSKKGSKSEDETIDCDPNNLVSSNTPTNAKFEVKYHYKHRALGKDLYWDAIVIRVY